MGVHLRTKSGCGFEFRFGHTSYSSKRFWRGHHLEHSLWCLLYLCFVFVWFVGLSQASFWFNLDLGFGPWIFFSWKVKGLMNTWKHGELKPNFFDAIYIFSKSASLCMGIWRHAAPRGWETVQHSAQSTSNCIFSNSW